MRFNEATETAYAAGIVPALRECLPAQFRFDERKLHQRQLRGAERNIQSGLNVKRQRLQGDRALRSADQYVRAAAEPE